MKAIKANENIYSNHFNLTSNHPHIFLIKEKLNRK